ncbi:unnamed protein product [Caenorhabditis sp. 36 PRJEB53466]|nr:unnamed protein product [Caenorhabditis sp. 36 PRJEB53466]
MNIKKQKPKFLPIPREVEQEDAGFVTVQTDRIPSVLIVRWFDLFCFGFAMCSYILDFSSDIGIAIMHFLAGRTLSGALILTFAMIPSIIINIISWIWMRNDELKHRNVPESIVNRELTPKKFISLRKMTFLCVFQIGPLFWYYKALYYGSMFRNGDKNDEKERRKNFSRMVEAETDATLLRCFEAFLESAPQMLIQGSIAANYFQHSYISGHVPYWLYFQAGSLLISIISVSWSIVVQNRSLRMISDNKVNIWPHEAVLQFCWRFLTIFARIVTLCAYVLVFRINVIALFAGHLLASLIHVIILQALHIEHHTNRDRHVSIEKVLPLINTLIHVFTPFNMVEGYTRYRYFVAYTVELFEMLTIFLFLGPRLQSFPLIGVIRCTVLSSFVLGICVMIVYYQFFHPNRRLLLPSQTLTDIPTDLERADGVAELEITDLRPKDQDEAQKSTDQAEKSDTAAQDECHN